MTREILIRADDLGFSEGVNYGIEKSMREGIIKSVGMMTNMPATEHGYNLIKDLDVCMGLHTNICVGKPLCDPSLIPSLCDEQGNLKASKVYRDSFQKGIDFVVLEEVILEIEAQYQRFVELTGDQPHYFEGHAVASANFFKGLEIVAKRHNCEYLGMNFTGPTKFRNTLLYTSFESMMPNYDPIDAFKRAALKELKENERIMFVCHPGYLDQYILDVSSLTLPRPLEVAMACSDEIKQFIKDNDVKIITYDDLK